MLFIISRGSFVLRGEQSALGSPENKRKRANGREKGLLNLIVFYQLENIRKANLLQSAYNSRDRAKRIMAGITQSSAEQTDCEHNIFQQVTFSIFFHLNLSNIE